MVNGLTFDTDKKKKDKINFHAKLFKRGPDAITNGTNLKTRFHPLGGEKNHTIYSFINKAQFLTAIRIFLQQLVVVNMLTD